MSYILMETQAEGNQNAQEDNNEEFNTDMETTVHPASQFPPAPTPSLASAIGSTVNSALPSTTRRSTRKRKEREEFLPDLSAALEACLCGRSAAPSDDADHPNVARCKNQGIISGAWNKAASQIVGSVKPAYLLGVVALLASVVGAAILQPGKIQDPSHI
ncbi:hypothetical protein FB451DRAFT_1529151 [Mycena latifolia]|nr:hypothetical protein FB451DRAFT_1534409 [Mycena latifolia]KAJ7488114.1 hypothetical protein FB451DRAFT_1529151 [Mycena latifolia]